MSKREKKKKERQATPLAASFFSIGEKRATRSSGSTNLTNVRFRIEKSEENVILQLENSFPSFVFIRSYIIAHNESCRKDFFKRA